MTAVGSGDRGGRNPRRVAASILGVMVVGGFFATIGSGGSVTEALIHSVILVLVFWFPAMRLRGPADLLTHGRSLVGWLLAWTLVWDLATAGVLGERTVFQEWWLVYPSGVIVLGALLLLHAWLVRPPDPAGPAPGD